MIELLSKIIDYLAPFFKKKVKERLSTTEEEILLNTGENGEIYLIGYEVEGNVVGTSKKAFEFKDRYMNLKYEEALYSLCDKNYVKHEEGMSYLLTTKGFEKAKELKGKK